MTLKCHFSHGIGAATEKKTHGLVTLQVVGIYICSHFREEEKQSNVRSKRCISWSISGRFNKCLLLVVRAL